MPDGACALVTEWAVLGDRVAGEEDKQTTSPPWSLIRGQPRQAAGLRGVGLNVLLQASEAVAESTFMWALGT